MRCQVCGRKSSRTGCDGCWTRGLSTLKELPNYYFALEAFLLPAKGYGEKVQGTRTPPLPARLNVLHLRAGGISGVVEHHEVFVRLLQNHSKIRHRGNEGQRITKSVEYLKNQWDWMRDNYRAHILLDLFKLYGEIHDALGNRSEDITIGSCPAEDRQGQPCGAILRISLKALESMADIRCPNCATVWESTKWRLLGQIIEQSQNSYHVGTGGSSVQGVTENHPAMGA